MTIEQFCETFMADLFGTAFKGYEQLGIGAVIVEHVTDEVDAASFITMYADKEGIGIVMDQFVPETCAMLMSEIDQYLLRYNHIHEFVLIQIGLGNAPDVTVQIVSQDVTWN